LFVLDGLASTIVLVIVWVGALVGIGIKLYRVDLHVLSGFLYLGLGWVAIAMFPSIMSQLAAWQVALLLVGGVVYSLGALVLALRRPDPLPHVFGFHEVWHTATIVAAVCFFTVIMSAFVAA
jgi:hemolysin III